MSTPKHESALYAWIGGRVRELRDGRFTQEELADLVGLSRTSVTNLERGRQRIPVHLLLRLAEALDCELDQLLPARADLEPGTNGGELGDLAIVGELTPAMRVVLSQYTGAMGDDGSP